MRPSDQSATPRIDASYSLPFLAACAAALSELKLLEESDADALRLSFKDRQSLAQESHGSLFSQLLAAEDVLPQLLQARCGSSNFSQIFLSWTLARALDQSILLLEGLAGSLLQKAELMFNQDFWLYQDGTCERRSLFSFFLVDLAEDVHLTAEALRSLTLELRVIHPLSPRGSERGDAWEQSLAQHLGFRCGTSESNGLNKMQSAMKQLFLQLELFADRMGGALQQLAHNVKATLALDRLQLSLEDWYGQLGQLRAVPLLSSGSLERMESKRLRLLSSILALNELIELQQRLLLDCLKTSHLKATEPLLWPDAERRDVRASLIAQGHRLAAAELAVITLEAYCRQHGVAPHLLLDTELTRIHPGLTEGILQILQKLAMDRDPRLLKEKQSVLQRKNSLMQAIQDRLPQLCLVLMASSWWLGCGVKTTPQSEVLDLRPSVPYHADQRIKPSSPIRKEQPAPPAPK